MGRYCESYQVIKYLVVTFYKKERGYNITEDDIKWLQESLNKGFNNEDNSKSIIIIDTDMDENNLTNHVTFKLSGKTDEDNLEVNLKAKIDNYKYLPYNDRDFEGVSVYDYYYDKEDYLLSHFKCPDNWLYDVEDCEMDDEEAIIYNAEN